MGYQYFSEVIENSRLVTVMSVTSPPAKTPSGDMGCPKNIDSVVKKLKMNCEVEFYEHGVDKTCI